MTEGVGNRPETHIPSPKCAGGGTAAQDAGNAPGPSEFTALVIQGDASRCDCALPFDLDTLTQVSSTTDLFVGDSLAEWKGTLWADAVRNSRYCITVHAAPGSLPPHAKKRLQLFYLSLMLLRQPRLGRVFCFHGERNSAGRLETKRWGETPRFRNPFGFRGLGRVDNDTLREAWAMAATMQSVSESTRLSRGLYVLEQALKTHNLQERLHEFVRSLDALVKASSVDVFASRCLTFTQPSKTFRSALEKMYAVRSAVEHVNDGLDIVRRGTRPPEDVLYDLAADVEFLAVRTYVHLLMGNDLRRHFDCDSSVRAFWRLPEDERRRLWGTGVDVRAGTAGYRRYSYDE
jgi:hypothetical protein